jgi:uncharacterized protein (TIGR02246 family)
MEPIRIVAGTLEDMQAAWNRGDGAGFAAPFTDDAEFIDIRGGYHHGRAAIAAGHEGSFATFYKVSRIAYRAIDARAIGDGVVVGHGVGQLATTSGMLDGKHALYTMVLVRQGDAWRVTAFQNMLIQDGMPVPG